MANDATRSADHNLIVSGLTKRLFIVGGVSTLSRLMSSWAAGKPQVSATVLSAVTMGLAGLTVCLMPFWGSFVGQVILMVVYGTMVCKFTQLPPPLVFVTDFGVWSQSSRIIALVMAEWFWVLD